MKPEQDPITDDEWLIRLVWEDRLKTSLSRTAFEPRSGKNPDVDGISLFRQDCLERSSDVLAAIATDKRGKYGLVRIQASMFYSLSLTVVSKPIHGVLGHVVIPEINSTDFQEPGKMKLIKEKIVALTEFASNNIIARPGE